MWAPPCPAPDRLGCVVFLPDGKRVWRPGLPAGHGLKKLLLRGMHAHTLGHRTAVEGVTPAFRQLSWQLRSCNLVLHWCCLKCYPPRTITMLSEEKRELTGHQLELECATSVTTVQHPPPARRVPGAAQTPKRAHSVCAQNKPGMLKARPCNGGGGRGWGRVRCQPPTRGAHEDIVRT